MTAADATPPGREVRRADAPATLTEQEADVYACLCNVTRVLQRSLFDHHEPAEVESALAETGNLLSCLDEIAAQRQPGVWR